VLLYYDMQRLFVKWRKFLRSNWRLGYIPSGEKYWNQLETVLGKYFEELALVPT
jgi:hypothetical protein